MIARLEMPKQKIDQMDFYVCQGWEPKFHGQLSLRPKSVIGLPCNIGWQSEKDFEQQKDSVWSNSVPWSDEKAADLKAWLQLTKDEKEFLVARQIGYVDSQHVYITMGMRFLCLSLWFMGSYSVSMKLGFFNPRRHPAAGRKWTVIIFGMAALVMATINAVLQDAYSCSHDKWADRYAGLMGPDMCLAGYKYYEKQIKANRALYELSPGADKYFTSNGNIASGAFRTKHLSLSSRKTYMKQMYDNFMAKKEEVQDNAEDLAKDINAPSS